MNILKSFSISGQILLPWFHSVPLFPSILMQAYRQYGEIIIDIEMGSTNKHYFYARFVDKSSRPPLFHLPSPLHHSHPPPYPSRQIFFLSLQGGPASQPQSAISC